MDAGTRLQIEQACARLVFDAAYFADTQEYRRLAELFTEDGVVYRPTAPDQPLVGRDAIFESYSARPAHRVTRHLCTNLRVDIESEARARVRCYAQVFGADRREGKGDYLGPPMENPILVGEFDDLCEFSEGRWRIAERRACFVMHQPL